MDSFDKSEHHQMCLENTSLDQQMVTARKTLKLPLVHHWWFKMLLCGFLLQMLHENHVKIKIKKSIDQFSVGEKKFGN